MQALHVAGMQALHVTGIQALHVTGMQALHVAGMQAMQVHIHRYVLHPFVGFKKYRLHHLVCTES